ncbi:phosphatidylserine decarboxylase [Lonepinella koalarum]|uniref:Phosphatidylserine decarboxylase proenzyme n=1 Tax=Lonepinella koalarum TaxID=53417 RepID=A0A4R1KZT9_9PAST|nr:archaetidylserine decarboxylase [Lonepinella koalarum]MDH2926514.1 phosphatidylserine decarboxylase [Lonepinella koalarum]TCK69549.1 phosphatidylserine decarboxylase [Lonepinella koalarum]TFJ89793.1 phosphatidylserine decarboxylase [Lonepinella koalarum]TYG34066.1 phosphatidylserine decarboxylase [Lonepinella koalarum]
MNQFSYWQRIKVALQYIMPQLYLTQLAGWLAKQKWGAITHFAIKLFAKKYKVNMQEATKTEFHAYDSFNEFFVRSLAKNARQINQDSTALCLPADGKISQCGHISDNLLLQAKGHFFSLNDLLAEDQELVNEFKNGEFATTYLSPSDYHRVHMPCNATLRKMIYVPGDLFSVNPFLNTHVPNLLARNERVICVFDTEFGKMIQILVGATITASISTAWAGIITPPRPNEVKTWTYEGENAMKLQKGQEMGAFQLGSTVINLFQSNKVRLADNLDVDSVTRVGQVLAYKK